MKEHPAITVPTMLLHGELDGASLPRSTEGQDDSFVGGYHRRVLPGVGHFIPREQPAAVIDTILGR